LADVIIVDRIEVHPDVATLSIEITYRDIETGSTDVLNQEFR
jgi:hypothetical protein